MAGAAAALYGPLHGGANEAVLRMLAEIGDVKRVPEFIERVKAGEGRLMGFGHRVYKNYDPRAKIIKETADAVFEVTGRNPLLDIALELERIALEDDYFVSRKLYPNVDFYSGMIYQALGLPTAMFPVMFAIPRTAGWLAQWLEGVATPSRRSRGRARSTPARTSGTTCRSTSAAPTHGRSSRPASSFRVGGGRTPPPTGASGLRRSDPDAFRARVDAADQPPRHRDGLVAVGPPHDERLDRFVVRGQPDLLDVAHRPLGAPNAIPLAVAEAEQGRN